MPVGTSLGQLFDDDFHYFQNQHDPDKFPSTGELKPPETPDNNVLTPKGLEGNKNQATDPDLEIPITQRLDVYRSNPPEMPPGAPTEVTGAFKSSEATQVAPQANASPGASNDLSSSIPDFTNKSGLSQLGDDIFGSGEHDIRPALGSMLEQGKNAFALPGDVLSGKVQAGSIQEIERATDLAGLMVAGPAPVASKMADGTLGSFMGVKSATFNRKALEEAHEMTANGVHPDEVWDKTGTFAGWDSRWRQEVPDTRMKLKEENLKITQPPTQKPDGLTPEQRVKADTFLGFKNNLDQPTVDLLPEHKKYFNKEKLFLDQIMDHPELFKAYPELRNVKVETTPPFAWGVSGAYNKQTNTLMMASAKVEEFKGTLMHEIQHAIQGIEGFEQGASKQQFITKDWPDLHKAFNEFKANTEDRLLGTGKYSSSDKIFNTRNEYLDSKRAVDYSIQKEAGTLPKFMNMAYERDYAPLVEELKKSGHYDTLYKVAKGEQLVNTYDKKLFDKYQSVAGEVESRNVEARRRMEEYQRKSTPPQSTEDHARSEQIKSPLK